MTTQGHASARKPSPCLARQPILTKDEKVLGYELLFRENPDDSHFTADGESATSSVIDTLNVVGLDAVCDGRLAFINCTHQMLLKEFFLLLPPDKVGPGGGSSLIAAGGPGREALTASDRARSAPAESARDSEGMSGEGGGSRTG